MTLPNLIPIALVALACATLAVAVIQAWSIYRHPNLAPHPIINRAEAGSHGFKWVKVDLISSIIPPAGTPEGQFWSGFSLGVSRESGKLALLGIYLYGAEHGVGHYTWSARVNKYDQELGTGGHFNLSMVGNEDQRNHESRVLENGVKAASGVINTDYRPLSFSIEGGNIIDAYDNETGRRVFFTMGQEGFEDFLTFGPPPITFANVPYIHQPGTNIRETLPTPEGLKRLTFRIWDVYERPARARVIIKDDIFGYSYETVQNAQQTSDGGLPITIPTVIEKVEVTIESGGYHSITNVVALKEGNQIIDAFIEPKCIFAGMDIQCSQ